MRSRPAAALLLVAKLACLGLALATQACGGGGVQAYQRGHLAKQKMQLGSDAEALALEQHVYEYREGASGGYGTIGGGCGCN